MNSTSAYSKSNNASAFSKIIDNSIINFGLQAEDVKKFLDEMKKVLIEEFKESGESTSRRVKNDISSVIESAFLNTICSIKESQRSSEEEIKKAVQENFKALQKDRSNLLTTIKNDYESIKDAVNDTKEFLQKLYDRYVWHAEKTSGELLGKIETLIKTNQDNFDNELRVAWSCLKNANFDDAIELFEKAACSKQNNLKAEAYFGKALAHCKIQLVWDYINDCEQPICYDYNINFEKDGFYMTALAYAAGTKRREEFKNYAKGICAIIEQYQEFEKEGLDYDCFICVKVTDDANTERREKTADCKWIKDSNIYEDLKNKASLKPFYSEMDCANQAVRGSIKYEASILYALSRAKCMLLVCSKEEYLQTPWVKNEYTRFCSFLKNKNQNADDQIVIVFDGSINSGINLPNNMRGSGNQDYDRAGKTDYSDLIETIKNRVNRSKGYIERYWKYCPKCGGQYLYKYEVCPQRTCSAETLVDAHIYLNNLLLKEKEEKEKLQAQLNNINEQSRLLGQPSSNVEGKKDLQNEQEEKAQLKKALEDEKAKKMQLETDKAQLEKDLTTEQAKKVQMEKDLQKERTNKAQLEKDKVQLKKALEDEKAKKMQLPKLDPDVIALLNTYEKSLTDLNEKYDEENMRSPQGRNRNSFTLNDVVESRKRGIELDNQRKKEKKDIQKKFYEELCNKLTKSK